MTDVLLLLLVLLLLGGAVLAVGLAVWRVLRRRPLPPTPPIDSRWSRTAWATAVQDARIMADQVAPETPFDPEALYAGLWGWLARECARTPAPPSLAEIERAARRAAEHAVTHATVLDYQAIEAAFEGRDG